MAWQQLYWPHSTHYICTTCMRPSNNVFNVFLMYLNLKYLYSTCAHQLGLCHWTQLPPCPRVPFGAVRLHILTYKGAKIFTKAYD